MSELTFLVQTRKTLHHFYSISYITLTHPLRTLEVPTYLLQNHYKSVGDR